MLRVAEMGVHLAFQGALEHDLGQPAQQAARPGQLQALRLRPLGQLPRELQLGGLRPPGSPSAVAWPVFFAAVTVSPSQTAHLSV